MNNFFSKNLPWKITSLILAFILWIFVINTQNPIQPREISGIKVVILGIEQLEARGYELKNQEEILKQNFKVVVNGPRLDTDKLVNQPESIVATLNLGDYINDLTEDSVSDTANYSVKINTDGYSVSIKERYPQVTKVLIDKIDRKEQKVSYEISSDITNQYTLIGDGKPVIYPEKIEITGAKSDIDRVSEAKVLIEAKDFSAEKLVSSIPIKLYDADGVEITSLEMSTAVAEVKLPIGSQKTVPIITNFIGEVPEGYVLTNSMVSPKTVVIIGKSEILNDIKKIELEPINLSNIKKSDFIQVGMKLPEGVMTLIDNKVSVSLEVAAESTLVYPIPTSELELTVEGIGDGLSYEILTPMVEVCLSALPDKLVAYSKADIKATLDLTGYLEGDYSLPLVIVPPQDARVVNSPITINVRVKSLGDTVSPLPDGNEEITDHSSIPKDEEEVTGQ